MSGEDVPHLVEADTVRAWLADPQQHWKVLEYVDWLVEANAGLEAEVAQLKQRMRPLRRSPRLQPPS